VTRHRYSSRVTGKGGKSTTVTSGLSNQIWPDLIWEGSCDDIVGNRSGVNPFETYNTDHRGIRVNGKFGFYTHENVVLDHGIGWSSTVPGSPNDSDSVTMLLARTNPSRPYIDPGMLAQDIYDLPKMVKDIGFYVMGGRKRPSPKMIANGYLSWNFGWAPLVDDLKKLLAFQTAVEKRKKDLHKLSQGGLHRRTTVFTGKNTTQVSRYVPAVYGPSPLVNVAITTTTTKWASVVYRPTTATPKLDDSNIDRIANDLVFGKNLSFSTVWQLMPWTWLEDWFTSFGDFLAASRNAIGTVPTDICVMTHDNARITGIYPVDIGDLKVEIIPSNGVEHKTRRVGFTGPSIELRFPFLGGEQLSTLSSLAIQRLGGK
jgi:hypothetical protein